jgi:hypothetical protein
MPNIDLSILNQRQTPAFYADVLANRPAAGFIGRIFVSTNTFEFYRDNGTGWDLIGGPGAGTITGSGAAGQVSYWNGASTITGSNDLFFDAVNGHLGIGTITPSTALTIFHDQNQIVQLNQTTGSNDTKIAFQNSGTPLWRIGNSYNLGENDFGIYDVVGAVQPFTIKKNTQQVLIGGGSGGSGKLVVTSGASDNGVQIVGANAPSLRIDNLSIGATKRVGLGIATALNNFIQGAVDGNFCIFNGTTSTPASMLFGIYDAGLTNVQEAARISAARNFIVGSSTDTGQRFQVTGTTQLTGITQITGQTFITGSTTASAGTARGAIVSSTLVAAANNDVLVGLDINPTYTNGAFTGLTNTALRVGPVSNAFVSSSNASRFGFTTDALTFGQNNFNISTNAAGAIQRPNNASRMILGTANVAGLQPAYLFAIDSLQQDRGLIFDRDNSYVSIINGSNTNSTTYSPRLTVFSSGRVAINTLTDAGFTFDVNGTARVSNALTLNGAYTNSSDVSLIISASLPGINLRAGSNGRFSIITNFASGNTTSFAVATGTNNPTQCVLIDHATNLVTFSGAINISNTVAAAVAAPSTHKVSILIGGVQYYLLASNV